MPTAEPADQRTSSRSLKRLRRQNTLLVSLHDDFGGAGLYEAQGLHRIFRDIHAATQHAQLQKVGFRTKTADGRFWGSIGDS